MYKTPVRRSAGALQGSVPLSPQHRLVQISVTVSVGTVAVAVRVCGAGQRQMMGHRVRGERSGIVDGRRMDDVRCHRVGDLEGNNVSTCVLLGMHWNTPANLPCTCWHTTWRPAPRAWRSAPGRRSPSPPSGRSAERHSGPAPQ